MRVCLDCDQTLDIPRDTICLPCVRAYYAREKARAAPAAPPQQVEGSSNPVPESVSAPRSGHAHLGHDGPIRAGRDDAIEQTPRVRARACLYFRPANVTFSESEQE